jgi:hypothetical protein
MEKFKHRAVFQKSNPQLAKPEWISDSFHLLAISDHGLTIT